MKTLQALRLLDLEKWENFLTFRERRLNGFKTGIDRLDKELLGLSGIVGIQGSPGSCKSTLALQIASNLAKEGTPVLIIDRENGLNRFKVRLACQLNQVDQYSVLKCNLETLKKYFAPLKNLPIFVDTSADISAEQIRSYLTQMWDVYKRPMLLVVDSLQALPRFGVEERLALETWLGVFDQLKLDFDGRLVTIMTSEKRRGTYGEAGKDGGKGTGSIEFKCEILIDVRVELDSPVIKAQIVKNRDGATTGDLLFQRRLATDHPNSFTFTLENYVQEDY